MKKALYILFCWLALTSGSASGVSADGISVGGPAFKLSIHYSDSLQAELLDSMDMLVWSAVKGWDGESYFAILRDEHPAHVRAGVSAWALDHFGSINPGEIVIQSVVPDSFRVILHFHGRDIISDVYDVNRWRVSHDYSWQVSGSGFRNDTHMLAIPLNLYLFCFAATLILEFLVVLFWMAVAKFSKRVLWIVLVVNLLTHLPFWLLAMNGVLPLLSSELMVILLEGLGYWWLTRKQKKLYAMMLLSLAANITSYSVTAICVAIM